MCTLLSIFHPFISHLHISRLKLDSSLRKSRITKSNYQLQKSKIASQSLCRVNIICKRIQASLCTIYVCFPKLPNFRIQNGYRYATDCLLLFVGPLGECRR